jgi:hypothetical protein
MCRLQSIVIKEMYYSYTWKREVDSVTEESSNSDIAVLFEEIGI